jgi:hypothetical protein
MRQVSHPPSGFWLEAASARVAEKDREFTW